MINATEPKRGGQWDAYYEEVGPVENRPYSNEWNDLLTMKIGAAWLNHEDIAEIEDWGCGFGGFKLVIAEDQKYIGLDGSKTAVADKIVDFEDYTSSVDGAHMRGVIEHNYRWENVLNNFLASFTKRGVLTLFTPFVEETCIDLEFEWFDGKMPNISFSKKELASFFEQHNVKYTLLEGFKTDTEYGIEHVYLLEK